MNATLVSVEEYLASSYDPDVDYVDGELEDRNVGEKDHGKLQLTLVRLIDVIGGYFVTIETRIKVSAARFRVPDVCVYEQEPDEQVFVTAPLLVIEVLSPEDRMSRMYEKLEDYLSMGCQNVWILDPHRRKAYRYDGNAIIEVQDKFVAVNATRLTLNVRDIFQH